MLADPLRLAAWQETGSWPQFAHDPLHTGRSGVDLGTTRLEPFWQFRPSDHVWSYVRGSSVWSSPVVGTVDGRCLVVAGYYDRVVYAVDGRSGEKVWEFRPGAPVYASPALGRIGGRAMVFLAATNRSVYGLAAATGEKLWQYEIASWSFTQQACQMSSPTVVSHEGEITLVVGSWYADRSASRNVQLGELLAIDAERGELRWRTRLGSVPVTSPAVMQVDGELMVIVATQHGVVHLVRLGNGEIVWRSVLNEELRSSPSVALDDGVGHVLIGTRFHTLFSLGPRSGARQWRTQAGFWIDSTPAWFSHEGRAIAVGCSHDQRIYGWRVSDGEELWQVKTGNYAYSSAALARAAGRPVALASSWDEHLYMVEAVSGEVLWRASSGPLLWSHVFQGDSLWASPVVAEAMGGPVVLFPAFDGVLYAYRPAAGTSTPGSGSGVVGADSQPAAGNQSRPPEGSYPSH